MLWILVILGAALMLYLLLPRFSVVSIEEAQRKLGQGGHLVDVRTEPEFRQHSVPGSINIPLHDIKDRIRDSDIQPSDPILVFCQSGMRSHSAKKILHSMGYLDVHNLGAFNRAGQVARSRS